MGSEGGSTVPQAEIDVKSIPAVKERLLNNMEKGAEANMRSIFRDVYFLESKGVFNGDEEYRKVVENAGQDPAVWTGVYVGVRDRVNSLEDPDITGRDKDRIQEELKGLYHVAEVTKMDSPPQQFREVWERTWDYLNAQKGKAGTEPPPDREVAEITQRREKDERLFAESLTEYAQRAGISEDEAYKLWLESGQRPDKPGEPKARRVEPDAEPPVDGSQGAIPPAGSPDAPARGVVPVHNLDIPIPEPPPNPNQDRSIIVEREPGGDFVRLDNYLKEKGGKLPESEALEISIKMAEYLATIHSQGIERNQSWDPYELNAIYWDAKNKQLRLGKSDTEKKDMSFGLSGRVPSAGSYDRLCLAELMFRLATGLTLKPSYPHDTPEDRESFKKEFGVLGFANFANMYAPKREEIPAVLSPLSEGTRKVLIRALYPFMVGRDNGYGSKAADTKWMLLDLIAADKALKGEPVSEQMQSYYQVAEYRRNYLKVMEGKRDRFQTEVPADLTKKIEEDISKRMKTYGQTLDQIYTVMAGSYNFNLDKALENQ